MSPEKTKGAVTGKNSQPEMLSEDEDTTTADTSQKKKSLEISLYRQFLISELKAAEMHTQNPQWNVGIT